MREKVTILLVEDDVKLLNSNRLLLEREGYRIRSAEKLSEARRMLLESKPNMIVLDILLPDGNGLDFLKELRQTSAIPVLLLTSLGTPDDVVKGLKAGGDDYISKPFDTHEFRARIETMLRHAVNVPETLEKGALRLDIASGQSFLNGADMLLTQKEFSLLLLFTQNEGRVLSVETLYEKVWGQPMATDKRTLQKHISVLRGKLTGGNCDYNINPVYGKGYCFSEEKPG